MLEGESNDFTDNRKGASAIEGASIPKTMQPRRSTGPVVTNTTATRLQAVMLKICRKERSEWGGVGKQQRLWGGELQWFRSIIVRRIRAVLVDGRGLEVRDVWDVRGAKLRSPRR